jgi:hypothetical protein
VPGNAGSKRHLLNPVLFPNHEHPGFILLLRWPGTKSKQLAALQVGSWL